MKKLFTILLISCFAFNTSFAQVEQGTWILGATSDASNPNGWSNIQLQPTIGYFLTDQFVLGLGLSFLQQKDEEPDFYESTVTNTSIAPWMRMYFNERFFLHTGITVSSGSDKTDYDSSTGINDTKNTSGGFGLDVGPGFSLMWGDYVAVEPAMLIQMASGWQKPDGGDKTKDPSVLSVGFRIGVAVMLGY